MAEKIVSNAKPKKIILKKKNKLVSNIGRFQKRPHTPPPLHPFILYFTFYYLIYFSKKRLALAVIVFGKKH